MAIFSSLLMRKWSPRPLFYSTFIVVCEYRCHRVEFNPYFQLSYNSCHLSVFSLEKGLNRRRCHIFQIKNQGIFYFTCYLDKLLPQIILKFEVICGTLSNSTLSISRSGHFAKYKKIEQEKKNSRINCKKCYLLNGHIFVITYATKCTKTSI